jgi:hypothetical protein
MEATTSIAEADSILSDVGRRYFDLGWDFAGYFAIKLPPDATPEMRQGYDEGRRRLTPREPSRYDRKWLGLRCSALKRNRVVAPGVTPEFLQWINHPICPVTTNRMTCATGGDMDWSVDRVFNNGAYAEANLCIMSVKANHAKGDKLLPEVLEITANAIRTKNPIHGLTAREWMRLAAIMVGPHSVGTGQTFCLPQPTPVLPSLTTVPAQMIQEAILRHAIGKANGNAMGRMRAICTPKSERQLHKIIQAIRHKYQRNRWVFDVWLEPGVFVRFHDWYEALSADQSVSIFEHAVRAEFKDASAITPREVGQWALMTDGYGVPR